MIKPATVRCYFLFWDWKEQPDFKAIEASANWMLAHGATRIYLTTPETTDDSNCLVVSDSTLSPREATRAYNAWVTQDLRKIPNLLVPNRMFGTVDTGAPVRRPEPQRPTS